MGRRTCGPSDSEATAKAIVEAMMVGARLEYRQHQSAGQYDFDLQKPDGSVVPLEVTASVDRNLVETMAALESQGYLAPRRLCSRDWVVHPTATADIRKIHRRVDQALAAVEAEGLERFFAAIDAADSPAVRALYSIGIEMGGPFPMKKPGIFIATPSGDGGLVTHESVQVAIAKELQRPDNRRKLGGAGKNERHLFVLIGMQNFLPWIGLTDCAPPTEPPNLPEEITHVWAAGPTRTPRNFVAWLGAADGWTHLGVVAIGGSVQ